MSSGLRRLIGSSDLLDDHRLSALKRLPRYPGGRGAFLAELRRFATQAAPPERQRRRRARLKQVQGPARAAQPVPIKVPRLLAGQDPAWASAGAPIAGATTGASAGATWDTQRFLL